MGWRRGMALMQDLRDRVLAVPGASRDVAVLFGESMSKVVKARARRRSDGRPGRARHHGRHGRRRACG